MIRVLLLAMAAAFAGNAALADVTFCNRTNSRLQYAIAAPIATPYRTNEINGWFMLAPSQCRTFLIGNYKGQLLHYYVHYRDSNRRWGQTDSYVYKFCVTTSRFTRRGTWDQLQFQCPRGWFQLDFYRITVPSENYTLNFTD